jgi:hypothetical protein
LVNWWVGELVNWRGTDGDALRIPSRHSRISSLIRQFTNSPIHQLF